MFLVVCLTRNEDKTLSSAYTFRSIASRFYTIERDISPF